MKLSAWSLLLSCVMFAACDSTESPSNIDELSLPPLTVGDQWIMERTDEFDFREPVVVRDTLRITNFHVIEGEVWYLLSSTHGSPFGDAESASPWLTVRDTGLWKRRIAESGVSEPRLVLAFPLAVDEAWTSPSGLLYERTADTETFRTSEGNVIPVIPYRTTTTAAYRPFKTSTGALGELEDRTLENPLVFENKYSTDVGFVQLEGAWMSAAPSPEGPEYANVVGAWRLSLVRFIPAG